MSFIGTQQKCKACGKTVYPVELLSADGVDYHKSCFKCSHCKGTLKLSNYSSMEGVLYCKPHFEQLFKESGNFNKNFQSRMLFIHSFLLRFRVTVENEAYHKSCFKCSHGGCSLSPSNYAALEGILYCKHHFSQLFKEKGSYNHLVKSATIKRSAAAATAAAAAAAAATGVPEA
ncbi:Zinc finger, LIM-type [Cynara cardunculus var. scolymus]|uniref:Zinc finger, LIM-type n=1 Tax=Cynara cardunculus var. scolymus TaxID=59895 RepID=A0A103Y9A1_CYNCS|nr:Zinc finger, LIM-type [Cynara cardunculus var. scolymus]